MNAAQPKLPKTTAPGMPTEDMLAEKMAKAAIKENARLRRVMQGENPGQVRAAAGLTAAAATRDAMARIIHFVAENPGATTKQISAGLDLDNNNTGFYLLRLLSQGKVTRQRIPGRAAYSYEVAG